MSQIQYCNTLLFFILFSVLFGKLLTPDFHSSSYSEVLTKKNKEREYYELTNNGLEYTVKGPAELKIFSKSAYPKKTNNEL